MNSAVRRQLKLTAGPTAYLQHDTPYVRLSFEFEFDRVRERFVVLMTQVSVKFKTICY